MQPFESLTAVAASGNLESCLSEPQVTAAYLLGRCTPRKQVMAELGIEARVTLWRWLQIPDFQDAVRRSNREWLAELNERKARIIEKALELEEAELDDALSKKRANFAHEIARNVLR
jgi:hypothetical protein